MIDDDGKESVCFIAGKELYWMHKIGVNSLYYGNTYVGYAGYPDCWAVEVNGQKIYEGGSPDGPVINTVAQQVENLVRQLIAQGAIK